MSSTMKQITDRLLDGTPLLDHLSASSSVQVAIVAAFAVIVVALIIRTALAGRSPEDRR